MIPMKTRTIFTSRWWALVWAAGILWAVHDFVGMSRGDDAEAAQNAATQTNDTAGNDDAQIAALANQVSTLKAQ